MQELFISWSGKHSKIIASHLKTTLEEIFGNEDFSVFMSEKDIESGTEWFRIIKNHLTNSSCAIIVLTKENTSAPWVLFESGAMAINHEDKRVIPILFEVDIEEKSPLSHYNHIKFSKDGFEKMILDIKKFCKFKKMTNSQLLTVVNESFSKFNDKITKNLDELKELVVFGSSYIYPKTIRTVTKRSVFISSPMNSSRNDDEYKALRSNILSLCERMTTLDFSKVIYPGESIESKSEFEGESIAINSNFKKLKSAECLLAIYPQNVASSILTEIGYAIALTKKIVIFTKNKNKLPFMLREANMLSNIKIFQYRDFSEIEKRIVSNGYALFDLE